jgi:hypothetical protein
MATKTIDQLPSSSPLTGSEVLPIVQGNETVKTTVQEIGSFTRPYKVYTALLTQTGDTAPTSIVLENTLGNVTLQYFDVGYYQIVLENSIDINKTFLYIGNGPSSGGRFFFEEEGFKTITFLNSTTIVVFSSTDGYATGLSNNELENCPIEIRVYN